MNKFTATGSMLILFGSISVASAQPGPPAFDDIDTDQSGALSQAEIGAMVERFAGRRRGAGGERSEGPSEERDQSRRRGPDPERMFGRMDTDGDGSISREEFDARPRMGGRGGPGGGRRGEGRGGEQEAI